MLEDFDFTDNLTLLSHVQEKTCHLSKFGQQVGLQSYSKIKTGHDLKSECTSASLA